MGTIKRGKNDPFYNSCLGNYTIAATYSNEFFLTKFTAHSSDIFAAIYYFYYLTKFKPDVV